MTMPLLRSASLAIALLGASAGVVAQETRDFGLPPPYDNPYLPPAVNPALPPPTGQRYLPGTSGPFTDPDRVPRPQRFPPPVGFPTAGVPRPDH